MKFGWLFLFCAGLAQAQAGFDYAALENVVRQKHLVHLADVLPELPSELRSQFTLMYRSQSLQAASDDAPRAILFGNDGRLALAFNGEAKQAGFSSLEAMEFDAKAAAFRLHRIDFPADRGETGPVDFSGPNPRACLGCHQPDPRPNWAFYDQWPGAYGSNDDAVTGDELKALQSFFSAAKQHPRYRWLLPAKGVGDTPYEANIRGRLRFRPNFRWMAMAFAQNADRLTRMLHEKPGFPRWRYLFVLSRLRCELGDWDLAAELKAAVGASVPNVSRDSLYSEILKAVAISDADFTMSFLPEPDTHPEPYAFPFGLSTFDHKAFLQADAVVARLMSELGAQEPRLQAFLKEAHLARERFGKDPADIPLAHALDKQLALYDFNQLRAACPTLATVYRERFK